jgi:HPt (histidine-containing phosphotransfer) domain-containing protein
MSEPVRVAVDAKLKHLLPGFLASRRKDLEEIREGLSSDDLQRVRAAGRSLRAFARVYSFDTLVALGERLHEAVDAADRDAIARLERQLAECLDRIEIAGGAPPAQRG